MKRSSVVIVIVVIGLVLLGAWYGWNNGHDHGGELVLGGNVEVRQANLSFKVAGRIASLNVDEGDAIKPGQILAQLEKSYFEEELSVAVARRAAQAANLARLEHGARPEEKAQAQANVADRAAAAENARQQRDRSAALVGKGFVSKQSLDSANAAVRQTNAQLDVAKKARDLVVVGPRREDIDAARAALAAEQASVEQVQRRMADAALLAPEAGVILTRAREAGAIVKDGDTIYTLALITPVWIRAYVAEPELARVKPGTIVNIETDTPGGKKYAGKIGFISPTAEFTPKSVETRELRTSLVYRIRVVVDNPDGALRQGMPVTIRIPAGAAQ